MFKGKVKVNVEINEARILYQHKLDKAQKWLDLRVMQDSNQFAPQDTSNLIRSSILHTVIGSGLVIWNTVYARYQYFGISKNGNIFNYSKDKNPRARSKWFEAAKDLYKKEWFSGVVKIFKK